MPYCDVERRPGGDRKAKGLKVVFQNDWIEPPNVPKLCTSVEAGPYSPTMLYGLAQKVVTPSVLLLARPKDVGTEQGDVAVDVGRHIGDELVLVVKPLGLHNEDWVAVALGIGASWEEWRIQVSGAELMQSVTVGIANGDHGI